MLDVNRRYARKADPPDRKAVIVLLCLGFLAIVVATWLGLRWVAGALYWKNPQFAIRRLEMPTDSDLTTFIREKHGIVEGRNLFAFNLRQMREDFLKTPTRFKSMEIARQLPDTLRVVVSERTPVARVGTAGQLVTDGDGFIYRAKSHSLQLPLIASYSAQVQPGQRLTGMGQSALQVLQQCNDHPTLGLQIESIDVGRLSYLTLRLTDQILVKLYWKRMEKKDTEGTKNLLRKLDWVSRSVSTAETMGRATLDATLDDGRIFAQ